MNRTTLYTVYENTEYVDLPWGRYDIGSYYVEDNSYDSSKAVMVAGAGKNAEFIKENVFESREEANAYALKKTIEKLNNVLKAGKKAK